MKAEFKFSNLLGTVYKQGNLLFTPDGTGIISPVGNRVSFFDLVNNKSFTFPYEHRQPITNIALNPQATIMLSCSADGRAILVNFHRRTVLHHFNFKAAITDIQFSPDGTHFAVTTGRFIQIWRTPKSNEDRQFAPFVRHRIYAGHYSDITSVTWSPDSRFFLTTSKDLTARIYSLSSEESAAATTLAGHRDTIVKAFWSEDQETIYTVSRDGALFKWNYVTRAIKYGEDYEEDEMTAANEERWRITSKHYFLQDNSKVRCATFHPKSNLLVVGFSTGIFTLYELPDFNMIQTLSISQNDIDYVTINSTGEWLAFGAAKLGQLLVWEWQSESYILKQQGHFDSMNSLVYSPDGTRVVTASDDGKIKVWDALSGFCIVTFTEHSAGVTALEFSKKGNVLFSASLDGSVRAWDLIRYRNFRTFTAQDRRQFSSLAIDPSGEIVCAGSLDDFDINVWSVQTSQLLDTLIGHTGPVSSLSFGNENGMLASASWDRTVRVWDIFSRSVSVEPVDFSSDVLDVAMSPNSKTIAVSTLDGQISFWDIDSAKQIGNIDGRKDISAGRYLNDKFTAKNSARSKYFTTICYSADGSCILAGGNSKYICLYDIATEVMIKKYTISRNMSIDGTLDMLNSKNMTENGPLDLIDTTGEASDLEDRIDNSLPGSSRGDPTKRNTRPAIRTTSIKFSPTGRGFAAASTEGLLVYSLDDYLLFDPFDLNIDITPQTTREMLAKKEFLTALIMAFRLNEKSLIHQVYESISVGDISLIARELPIVYLERILRFIAEIAEESVHVEFHLLWIKSLISSHGRFMQPRRHEFASVMRMVLKFVTRINKTVTKLSSENTYFIQFLLGDKNSAVSVDSISISNVDNAIGTDEKIDSQKLENGQVQEDEDVEFSEDEEGWFGPESKSD
ncbi:WD40 repeat-like protein, partial [Nadsonia fulvescens var. elongata DSM 6958]